jgi:hypothetical protein
MKPLCVLLLCAVPLFSTDDKYCLETGHVCHLAKVTIIQGLDWVPTAISVDAYDEFVKCLQANDRDGLAEMLKNGKLLLTKSGEGIRILDWSFLQERTEGRITTGTYQGKRVWATTKWVVR